MTAGLPDKIAKPVHEKLIGRNTKREKITAELYYQYLKTLVKIKAWKLNRKHKAPIKPLELIYIDPSEIKRSPKKPVENNIYPCVKDGEWDQNLKNLFEASSTARSLKQRFEDGLKWEETEFYKSKKEKFEQKNTQYAKNTQDSFEQKLERIDKLYQSIKENGYKKQTEIENPGLGVNDKINHRLKEFNDVAIHIGRKGQPIFASGSHRIIIATILGLEEIPVRVVCRHKKWQEKRINLAQDEKKHPDIRL